MAMSDKELTDAAVDSANQMRGMWGISMMGGSVERDVKCFIKGAAYMKSRMEKEKKE